MKFKFILMLTISFLCGQRTVAILDFDGINISPQETYALTERFRSEIKQADAHNIYLERNRMEEILTEQGLQQTGCISTECAVEIGKLLGAQDIIIGSISLIGKTYSINIRLVNIESGTITKTLSRDHLGEIDGLLTRIIPDAALEFLGIKVSIDSLTGVTVSVSTIRSMAKQNAKADMDTYHWATGSGCIGGVCSGSCLSILVLPLVALTTYTGYHSPVDIPSERHDQIEYLSPELQAEYKKAYRKEIRRRRGQQALIGAGIGLLIISLIPS